VLKEQYDYAIKIWVPLLHTPLRIKMPDLYINSYTSMKLASLFQGKEKHKVIYPETWLQLCCGELTIISFEDYPVLRNCYPNSMTVLMLVTEG
jgi:hypothetical protein